jgi:holin-like protein
MTIRTGHLIGHRPVGNRSGIDIMLWSFCILLACQAVGEAIHAATGFPIPGAILGIGLLVMVLACRGAQQAPTVLPAPDALLPYLSLMFVPLHVVAVLRMRAMSEAWLPIAAATVVSLAQGLGIAGRLAQALLSRSPGTVVPSADPRGTRP